jgi:hypothetical protein
MHRPARVRGYAPRRGRGRGRGSLVNIPVYTSRHVMPCQRAACARGCRIERKPEIERARARASLTVRPGRDREHVGESLDCGGVSLKMRDSRDSPRVYRCAHARRGGLEGSGREIFFLNARSETGARGHNGHEASRELWRKNDNNKKKQPENESDQRAHCTVGDKSSSHRCVATYRREFERERESEDSRGWRGTDDGRT